MDIKKLQALVIDALEDVKAQDIKVFDTVHLTSLFDRIAVASGTSNRQTKALAASVREKVKENGGHVLSVEGEDTGEWVLVDLGDMIVHIMQPAIRAYYRLEEIWGEKEVKFGAAKRTSKKSADDEEAPKKAVGRHLSASQTTLDDEPKKPARKTAVTRSTAAKAPAKKTTAKKAVGKTIKVATTKTAAAYKKEKAPAKKAPAKKVVSKAAAKTRAPAKPKSAE
ncbi:ribosome silencing factor [Herminiimonas fonticola]|uniref:Ribosomal silencing factor RsfS n=1 Tax=Herminiimonas fonticola TaxID=303380 RepID=A0A4R6G3Q5_9BURK|nr:ribosome silencing factor [Herminiimonas fonticola]RBA23352.1 iojap-like ribosome-associated protein [Herminiimonas fonticola]TDN89069.1 ribosome-associated protein [Herminiimonas fonticola]